MSKQKRGMFRGFIATMAEFLSQLKFWGGGSKYYADPLLRDPYSRPRSRKGTKYRGKVRVRPTLPCEPGTLRFHDKLVAHFGRRRAEGYRQCIQRKFLNLLPTEQDFADNPPWEFLKGQAADG